MRVERDGEGVVPELVLVIRAEDSSAEVGGQLHRLGAETDQQVELGADLGVGPVVLRQRLSQGL